MTNYSFVQYPGDGTIGPFVIPFPYLDRAHIAVSVDGGAAGFSFSSDSAVTLSEPAPAGTVVELRRITPRDAALVDFTDGSVLTEADLDRSALQSLYVAQETLDLAANAILLGGDGAYDAGSRRIRNVADPTDDQDAATKAYVVSQTADSVAAAAASASAAASSATTASSAATSASSSASAASTSATAAASAETAAETAQAAAEAAAASIIPLPAGGAIGQVPVKQSGDDGDVAWEDPTGGAIVLEVAGDPDADDDAANTGGNGVAPVGAIWINTSSKVTYVSVDDATGAADWRPINVQSGLIGEVIAWPASAVPSGFLACDGAAVSRATYAALFAVIGTTYGAGDGSTTFNLPDYRGYFLRGWDNGAGVDSGRALGDVQAEQVGDHQHQTNVLENISSGQAGPYFESMSGAGSQSPFGYGDDTTSDLSTSTSASSAASKYTLTDDPYSGTDGSGDNRPVNVSIQYIIRARTTYDIADLTPSMPSASDTAAGAVELATQAEVNAGVDPARAVTPATLNGALLPQAAPHVILEDQKASSMSPASLANATWNTRELNTEVRDELGVSLSSNAFTLPAGTYYIEASAPAMGNREHQARLYNVTDAATALIGRPAYSNPTATVNHSDIAGVLTIADSKTFRLEHNPNTTGNGGYPRGAGLTEIYARVLIWRIA